MLFFSRLCLAIEYAHTLAQIYKYKRARLPLHLQIAINAISVLVYLGITFRFQGKQSRVYITWYIFTTGEAILSLGISNYWKTLSFYPHTSDAASQPHHRHDPRREHPDYGTKHCHHGQDICSMESVTSTNPSTLFYPLTSRLCVRSLYHWHDYSRLWHNLLCLSRLL